LICGSLSRERDRECARERGHKESESALESAREREKERASERAQFRVRASEMAMMGTSTSAVVAAAGALLPTFQGLRGDKITSKSDHHAAVPSYSSSSSYQRLAVVANKRVQKRKQVVLTEDVQHLGKAGELLAVKTGYFRNFLYPFGKAKIATAELLKSIRVEEERKEEEKRRIKAEAESVAKMFQSFGPFSVRRKKGGQGKQIFGSVTTQDIIDIIRANTSQEIDKRIVTLPEIREVGQYIAEIKLHVDVIAQVKINVIGQ
jgi:large subunit ribosomal protein L9